MDIMEPDISPCLFCNDCKKGNHCSCPYECQAFMLDGGCKSLNPGWSVQAEKDFIG